LNREAHQTLTSVNFIGPMRLYHRTATYPSPLTTHSSTMFMLRKPAAKWIDGCLRLQRRLPFSYRDVGATRDGATPAGYRSAVHRVCLGEGAATFARAKEAIRGWKMFPQEFLHVCWPQSPIEPGSTVGILCRSYGLWSLLCCRIVYVVDEPERDVERFGFAYGTLPKHMESGEERFVVEWDHRDDRVWYEVRMFCRPPNWLARLVDPIVRRLQRKFGALTKEAMLRAVILPEPCGRRGDLAPRGANPGCRIAGLV
jgi:uncharacterized protein (UPF0548 family)